MRLSKSKGFTLVEILVSLAIIGGGLIGLLAIVGTFIDIADNIQDRTMARLIAQNYFVAIQRLVTERGYNAFTNNGSVGMMALDGRTDLYGVASSVPIEECWALNKYTTNTHKNLNGSVRIIEVSDTSTLGIKTFSPPLTAIKTLYPERENSNGEYWVRILYQDWKCSTDPPFSMKIIKLSVGRYDRLSTGEHEDFWYCITNYVHYGSPLFHTLPSGELEEE